MGGMPKRVLLKKQESYELSQTNFLSATQQSYNMALVAHEIITNDIWYSSKFGEKKGCIIGTPYYLFLAIAIKIRRMFLHNLTIKVSNLFLFFTAFFKNFTLLFLFSKPLNASCTCT